MDRVYWFLCVLFLLLLGWQASSQDSTQVTYPAKILKRSEQVCPSNDQLEIARDEIRQDTITLLQPCPGQSQEDPATSCLEISQCNLQLPSEYYWITSFNGSAVQIYCDMIRVCSCDNATFGGWSRVAYLNMTDPTQHCPPEWREITEPVRTCGRTNQTLRSNVTTIHGGGCSSVSFQTYNISYSHICGRIIGYQLGSPNAFYTYSESIYTRIEDPYVDGVVIVRGTEKQHIWTFVGEISEVPSPGTGPAHICPCTNAPNTAPVIPPFVSENYFCETATSGGFSYAFFPNDPLWDGKNCGSRSTCCKFNNPPYFCRSLPETTDDSIEVRICGDQDVINEDTPIEFIEIFVQ